MQFMLQDMASYAKTGDANWERWFGTDKTKWAFNTVCCATQVDYQMAQCLPAQCVNKCDQTRQCSQPTCAALVKKYPCSEYYAPGKEYAGWCDKECGYGTCAHPSFLAQQLVVPL